MTMNFNNKFLNYNYIHNYTNIYNYLHLNNLKMNECNEKYDDNSSSAQYNEDLYYFYNIDNFIKMTKYMNNVIKLYNENNINKYNSNNQLFLNNYNIVYIKDDYFADFGNYTLKISYYLKGQIMTAVEIPLENNNNLNNYNNFGLFQTTDSLFYNYKINISSFDKKIIVILNPNIYIFKYNINEKQILILGKISLNNWINYIEIKKDYFLSLDKNNNNR